jgi:hypothetical protein
MKLNNDISLYNTIMKRYRISLMSVLGLLSLAIIFTSCDEPVKLDLDQTPPKVVIDGVITNHPGYQSIKVSHTADFYANGKTPKITNALVTVSDNAGNVYTFVHNPRNHADSAGIYIPQTAFQGVVGRTYKLHVEADGKVFEAEDQLYRVTKIDSLNYQVNEDEAEDPELKGRIYDLLLYTKEPRNETNYYLFKFYRNDSLTYNSETDIYYSDDEFLAENIDGVESPILYSLGDKGKWRCSASAGLAMCISMT